MTYNAKFMRSHAVMMISENENEVVVGCVRPRGAPLERLRRFHRKPVRAVSVELRDIAEALGVPEAAVQPNEKDRYRRGDVVRSLDTLSSETALDDIASSVLSRGVGAGASDICIESAREGAAVKHRIHGVMQEESELRPDLGRALVAKLKAIAGMDSLNLSRPQDGRMTIRIAGTTRDVRVSSIPIRGGESLSLRLLADGSGGSSLEELGFGEAVLRELRELHRVPAGLILVSGPADSGKTTTIHSILANAVSLGRRVMTVEDPVEYTLAGAAQISCPDMGASRVDVLRAVLRQNPDVLLIGEIRDGDTLALAIRAALTGHLVFASIHAATPRQCVRRLLDLGAGTESLTEAANTVIAQRLLRMRCPECATGVPGRSPCLRCHGVGYHERIPVGEVARCSGELESALAADGTTLRAEADSLVAAGTTDPAEVARVLGTRRAV